MRKRRSSAIQHDPAMYVSEYPRNRLERYWTHPWMTRALVDRYPEILDVAREGVCEPAAGRGDMSRVLRDEYGLPVYSSDVDASEIPEGLNGQEADFLHPDFRKTMPPARCVITNPPFRMKVDFLQTALSLSGVVVVAMLLRSDFRSGIGRRRFFDETTSDFACEIVLTCRPRWDWWFREWPTAGPRHLYSWFIWDRRYQGQYAQQRYHYLSRQDQCDAKLRKNP